MSLQIVSHIHEEPVVWCLQCGAGFGASKAGRPYQEHVVSCANRYETELREMSLRHQAPQLFDPLVSGDVEFGQWVRNNRAAIFHGRVRI
jgi:hypothetical protein